MSNVRGVAAVARAIATGYTSDNAYVAGVLLAIGLFAMAIGFRLAL